MKKYLTLLLIIVFIVLTSINLYLVSKENKCVYEIDEHFYKEMIIVKLKRFGKITITKDYEFYDEKILEIEKEELINNNYNIKINDLNISATKKEKINSFNKKIKELEESGFVCK